LPVVSEHKLMLRAPEASVVEHCTQNEIC